MRAKPKTRAKGILPAISPAIVAAIVAVFGIAIMLAVDHGPSSKPDPTYPQVTTEVAAQIAGAKVTPTVPESPIIPKPPGPAPANPVDGRAR